MMTLMYHLKSDIQALELEINVVIVVYQHIQVTVSCEIGGDLERDKFNFNNMNTMLCDYLNCISLFYNHTI